MMTTPTETTSKRPTHSVYILKPRADCSESDWIKVGSGWDHGDKDGLNLSLTVLGQNIPVIIRRNKPKA
ncbi:hypothetical protein [Spirosoma foliorum]|uniref:Uncharacterized protein n=1 Tax=Spirosoma foliorum TaxID=2710596 RepID=A0A7G5GRI6_9BACT|nr:hypothetical protein [Spirosoma foliorum]QMW01478.1 hypothetical protein H3H32_26480 [Spirosoma foliorum]